MKPVMILEMIASPIRALVMEFYVDYMVGILISDVDHADHIEC